MAVNEKSVYATEHVTHGGRLFRPGEQLSGRVDPSVIKHAQEGGLTTDSQAQAQRAQKAETERRARVAEEIAGRSEKRDRGENRDIPNLVRLPDGTYANAT